MLRIGRAEEEEEEEEEKSAAIELKACCQPFGLRPQHSGTG